MEWLNGMVVLPWWGYVLVVLALTHITIASVTIYLHRHQAHRALDLHPLISHFFRFWLWLTTAQVTKEWAAIHRKHHAKCESAEDPHSPQILGIGKVFWQGWELYRAEAANLETLQKYGHGTPDDFLERNLYSRYASWGPTLMAVIDLLLFGVNGIWIWAVQMLWIPVTAAGIINGFAHYWGYRNFETEDASTNLIPWGILIGGEELHNNHHTFGTSAKLSYKWFEFDIGWLYIRTMAILGLAKIRKVAPKLKVTSIRPELDEHVLQAIIANRYAIAAHYARTLKQTVAAEIEHLSATAALPSMSFDITKRMKLWLKQDAKDTSASDKIHLELILTQSKVLEQVYQMRQELTRIWERSTLNRHELVLQLQDWCTRAENSGIQSLRDFSLRLRAIA
ncbi:DesA family fatty acid desaturase [Deefgea piscis]|uniref:DesA family fatty acid desaturase n=1 Tax=Deefgea piscis TaxID=2739061 RepID=UPI001C7EE867|nr:fatty acid desaturase [Deefgea piscis]QZA81773.1 fatty acid desaturase [Deefgea piscis]